MKRLMVASGASLCCGALTAGGFKISDDRMPLWPDGKIPDYQEQQIAAPVQEASAPGFDRAAHRMPYLEWSEAPTGKKTAEKICIELKDKVSALAALASASGGKGADATAPILRDAILALSALGFNAETANKMVAGVMSAKPELRDVETIIKTALAGGKK